MFHAPGTCAGWWARCPRILGTCRILPGHVPHAWDGACPSRASRTRSAHRTRVTRRGRVPRAGDACRMVGMLPPHPGNLQKLSQAFGTRPGRLLRVPRMWGQHAHHLACVPGAWNTPPTRRTCTHALRHVINYFTLLIYVL